MKLFSAEQIRLWDQYTIANEPIASIDLMERAAATVVDWLERNNYTDKCFHIFCGKGNNGGDGLAIARMLAERNMHVTVHILESGHKGTDDFQTNLGRLPQYSSVLTRFIRTEDDFPLLSIADIVIDALFGSGLNRGLEGVAEKLVNYINESAGTIISIDMPSGLFTDKSSKGQTVIKAVHTLSFQLYKLAFLLPENGEYTGDIHILDIGLHTDFYHFTATEYELIDETMIHAVYKRRSRFGHKGIFGHALIIAGSYGKIGAAVLASRACLRSGTGLLSCHIPKCGYDIMQTSVPEAMVMTDFNSSFNTRIEDDLSKYNVVGIGPGLGTASETKMMLKEILRDFKKPLVLDADALNCITAQKDLLELVPAESILTPHPKEFQRLFGETANEFERIALALRKAKEHNLIIIVKGHHTLIATPGGKAFFNSTGNAGMATAGSGDTLTGILTALLAQGYSPANAAVLGVWLHGLAGDIAAEKLSMEAMIAGDISDHLPQAFLRLSTL